MQGIANKPRSVQQVTERLDAFIQWIKDIHRPLMDGSKPADVLIVCSLHSTFCRRLTVHNNRTLGRTWSRPSLLPAALDWAKNRGPLANDFLTRGGRDSEVCLLEIPGFAALTSLPNIKL
jgi:hypothetical protein